MDTEAKAKEAFKTLEQMLDYRREQFNSSEKSPYAKKRIAGEIDTLEFLAEYAKEALSARGIHA